jgi:predicted TIM-barrel fold metal-dependent hydrolase
MTNNLTRRDVLKAGAALLAAAHLPASAAEERVPVVDTHLHCFAGKDDKHFPYHEKAPYTPPAATPELLLKCMDGAGVDYAIVVHPEPYQDDHRYLEHCLQVGKGRLKGTCLFFADRPGTVANLPALVKQAPVVAARIHAYAPERLPPFGKPELRDLWKQAGDLGLALQLHLLPRHAPSLEPLIKEFTDTRVIIDHLGRAFDGTPEEFAVIVRWSRFKNTIMKLSAIPTKEMFPNRDIAPVIRELTEAFGADRMIWGDNFGDKSTPESYKVDRERAAAFIAHLPATDQAKIFGGNAVKLFGFKPRG